MNPSKKKYGCPVEVTVDAIGGRWKSAILWWLRQSAKRPNELMLLIPGITQKVLTNQLRELEADGLIHRQAYRETPPRVEYSLTPEGETLRPLIEMMANWGKEKLPEFQFGIVSLKDIKLLLVADEPYAQRLRIQLGIIYEATVTIAPETPLEQIRQFQPDVVLVDLDAGSEDFAVLNRHIQQLEAELARTIFTIALANSDQRKQAFSQGFQVVLIKPVEMIELVAAIASFAGRLG
ncbi:winged helix-turn-helix transcriptional regulator [Leptolyngbya sp. FACHB-541]|nr:winged helix-turn-helix transcriptional regulator [Leptolyngbya sp. FACHB-541]MBD1999771.1 winged helix-turn-helix transcriptional regulator [Leptolyngbya sp. FACHB-541]